jgi:uncharacterized membrane protein YecN with MAPEG domain
VDEIEMNQLASLPALAPAAAYIAVLAIALVPLTFSVMRLRMVTETGLGDGGHERLAKAIRVHANYAENIPFGLALLLLLALLGSPLWAVHVLGLGLIIGRAFHALGLSRSSGPSPARGAGIMATQFSLLFGAVMILWRLLH